MTSSLGTTALTVVLLVFGQRNDKSPCWAHQIFHLPLHGLGLAGPPVAQELYFSPPFSGWEGTRKWADPQHEPQGPAYFQTRF